MSKFGELFEGQVSVAKALGPFILKLDSKYMQSIEYGPVYKLTTDASKAMKFKTAKEAKDEGYDYADHAESRPRSSREVTVDVLDKNMNSVRF